MVRIGSFENPLSEPAMLRPFMIRPQHCPSRLNQHSSLIITTSPVLLPSSSRAFLLPLDLFLNPKEEQTAKYIEGRYG